MSMINNQLACMTYNYYQYSLQNNKHNCCYIFSDKAILEVACVRPTKNMRIKS